MTAQLPGTNSLDHATLIAARLASIVETSDDAILSKTIHGKVLTWNAAAQRLFGYVPDEIIGRSIMLLVPEELRDEERRILERVGRGEYVAHYETARLRRDGTPIQVSLSIAPLRNADEVIVGASSIIRDITERRRAEEALRQAQKMEAIGRLAGGLAHDLNNQLYALMGFATFVSRDPGLSTSGREDLLEIQKAADRMASLTRQLLAFARQQVLSPETLDLSAAVMDAEPMLQRLIGSSIQVELSLGNAPVWVKVDRAQLGQILLNLVINARDAMPAGGRLTLRTRVVHLAAGQMADRLGLPISPGTYAELVVEDSGEGIAPEHLPRVFEPFYTTKEVGQGTGLGLSTVDGIVSQSGGRMRIASVLGEGTVVSILLPLAPEPAAPVAGPSAAEPRTADRKRVFLVEDEEQVRALLARTLREAGYAVEVARHGGEALEQLERNGASVDLVITDLVMPVMGGRELARALAAIRPELPLIWISGHPREVGLRDAGPGRNEPFLQKPIPSEVLLETVARVLRVS